MKYPPRVTLGYFPTPIEKLERLSKHLGGPQIYVKRDDQTGLATGGNKTRKLEFFIADALAKQCDHLVTLGGPQSNHCRQTAAAAARFGLRCNLVLRGDRPSKKLGNLLLDDLLGASLHWSGSRTREAVGDEVMEQLRASGHKPYLIPLGGSTPLGALGFVSAMEEAMGQLNTLGLQIDTMVTASSSAGTQAGMVVGAAAFDFKGKVLGISIDASAAELTSQVKEIALGSARLLGLNAPTDAAIAHNIDVNADYLGGGYAIVGDLERDAIRTVARTEGVLLDPVYTGRAMGGLIDLIGRRAFDKDQRILFWHTGGAAALSAFSDRL